MPALDLALGHRVVRRASGGAVARWDLHPLEKRRLTTSHTQLGHSAPTEPPTAQKVVFCLKRTLGRHGSDG
jgi:hypothetical protein